MSADVQPRTTRAVEAGGAATESMAGVAVVILTILALAGVIRPVLAEIAGIVFGAGFIVEGAAVAARHRTLMAQTGDRLDQLELGGGASVELVAGGAAIVLGILSLVGVAAAVLMPVLAIVGGAGLILSAGAVQRMNDIRAGVAGLGDTGLTATRAMVSSAAAGQVLAGIAAAVLGILSLVGVGGAEILTTVAVLVLGAAITLSGSALSGRMLSLFHRNA